MTVPQNSSIMLFIFLPTTRSYVGTGKEVQPLVEAYFAWVHEQDPAYILSEKTREGLKCSLNQEKYLKVFLEDGSIPIDNGAAVPGEKPIPRRIGIVQALGTLCPNRNSV